MTTFETTFIQFFNIFWEDSKIFNTLKFEEELILRWKLRDENDLRYVEDN